MKSSFSKVLVTGATGFVGKNFLIMLRSHFPEMTITVAGRKDINGGDFNISVNSISLDLTKEINISLCQDAIIHIAGEKHDEAKMWDVNFEGTQRLLNWAAKYKVKRFVYLSSVGVYGAGHNFGRVDETTLRNPKNVYEVSKNATEELVKNFCIEHRIEYVIIQPSNVIGWTIGGPFPLLALMKTIKRRVFVYLGGGNSFLNYVAVEDVAASLSAALLPSAENSTFIVNTPIEIEFAIRIIANEIGVAHPKIKLPSVIGKAGVTTARLISKFSGVDTSLISGRLSELTSTTVYDGSKIISKCDFSYSVGIELAIRRLARHYFNAGLL